MVARPEILKIHTDHQLQNPLLRTEAELRNLELILLFLLSKSESSFHLKVLETVYILSGWQSLTKQWMSARN